jgi:enamine deaminase RidA (YjgF/YER057c/UK114 family)
VGVSAEARLAQLGLVLPEVAPPRHAYRPWRLAGGLLFVSGQGPRDADGTVLRGTVGAEVDVEEGYRRARLVGLHLLAVVRDALGSLDRVAAVVKVLGMVRSTPDFEQTPRVVDGCSDLFLAVFGPEVGAHARSAVGLAALPLGISVEIEAIFEVAPD